MRDGIDLVKAQIRIAGGARIGTAESGVPVQEEIRVNAHALQCRVTTEDPENHFVPDYGRVTAYRSPAGYGIRLDAGTAYSGAIITRFYDSLLVKVTAWSPTAEETIARMHRALWEFRIRGVVTNLRFLDQLIMHPRFARGDYTTQFIDQTPELFRIPRKRDRATRLLSFIGHVIVNGNPEVSKRDARPKTPVFPRLPRTPLPPSPPPGCKQTLDELGAAGFAQWMLAQNRVLLTDTSMRDAHQSLLATRFRTHDMAAIAPHYAALLPELFSVECWGGATFDVALRFLKEDPWARLAAFREAMPNLLLQALLRSANAVGYANYPDNVVRYFVAQAAAGGIDVFRVFDCLNWVDEHAGGHRSRRSRLGRKLCEAAICYSGNLSDPRETQVQPSRYYLKMSPDELKALGAHVHRHQGHGAACVSRAPPSTLVKALKEEIGLPVHFHTHDTSRHRRGERARGRSTAGADAVDAADRRRVRASPPSPIWDRSSRRCASGSATRSLDPDRLRPDLRLLGAGAARLCGLRERHPRRRTSEVYVHGMPGGQYTNLREQARSLGIEEHRWSEVAQAYAEVNAMFGDIVKVTPTSKVVGDLAIMMVTSGLTPEAVRDPHVDVAFPESVVQLFRGELGQPEGGFPADLQKKVLGARAPLTLRAGELLAPADLEAERAAAEAKIGRAVSDFDLASYLMYPRVFTDYAANRASYGEVSILPTAVFFYGMQPGQEINIDLERGKTLILRYVATSDAHEDGTRTVFFELNGQPRPIRVPDSSQVAKRPPRRKAEAGNVKHVGAPMPGTVGTVAVRAGQSLARGDTLLTLEAMKMETTVRAEQGGVAKEVLAKPGQAVDAKDLLVVLE